MFGLDTENQFAQRNMRRCLLAITMKITVLRKGSKVKIDN